MATNVRTDLGSMDALAGVLIQDALGISRREMETLGQAIERAHAERFPDGCRAACSACCARLARTN